jgi:hypothetical protein
MQMHLMSNFYCLGNVIGGFAENLGFYYQFAQGGLSPANVGSFIFNHACFDMAIQVGKTKLV